MQATAYCMSRRRFKVRNGWKAAVAAAQFVGHPASMRCARRRSFLPRLFNYAALAVALSVTAPLASQDAPSGTEIWQSSCDAHGCSFKGDIAHGEEVTPRHMFIDVAVQLSGKVESVTFRLPPDADKGELFAVGFVDSVKDASGSWTLKLVPGATRILDVQDCNATCAVVLPNGIVPARNDAPAFDLGQAMTAHNLMLMFYFSHGERIRASAALFRFRDAVDGAMRHAPK